MESQHFAGLLFQKIAVDGTGTHHHHFLLQPIALIRYFFKLVLAGFNLVVERYKAQITTLARDQMITKIKRQTDSDHGDQVLAKNISLFDESLHTSNESHLSLRVKQNREMNQRVMWVHLQNDHA